MAGVDMLNLGTGGLFAARNALDVTSNNITNVNTEGYSRQRAQFETLTPVLFGGKFFGAGVNTADINRVIDGIANLELLNNKSSFNDLNSYYELSSRIDSFLSDPSVGVAPAIQDLFDAFQGLSTDPSSIPQREVVFNQLQSVSNRFNSLTSQLQSLGTGVNSEIQTITAEVNTIGKNIAKLNLQISNATVAGQGAPNDLLDKRDLLLGRLSELVGVSSFEQQDGSLNVFIGNGQGLVIGNSSSSLTTAQSLEDPQKLDIVLVSNSGQFAITDQVAGGKLGGVLRFRDGVLDSTINRLGKIALALSDSINRQNLKGMDLNDSLGGNLFADINSLQSQLNRVTAKNNNSGTLSLQVGIDNTDQLSDDNYRLTYNAGSSTYTLINARTKSVETTFPVPGALPSTISFASLGFSLTLNSGAVADGDSFLIAPTRNGAAEISRNITEGSLIAAASPLRLLNGVNNLGSGAFVSSNVNDITNAAFTTTAGQLTPPVRIEFTSATNYNIVNSTTNAVIEAGLVFTPNASNEVIPTGVTDFGYSVTLSGSPQAGDTFEISYNNGGIGDNRNLQLISSLQGANILESGTTNFQGSFGQLLTRVGVQTREASIDKEASQSLLTQAINRRETASGVNLDEEAANLIKFQQAYQASAQIITVANSLFQTLINTFR